MSNEKPDEDLSALAKGGRQNFFGFLLRLVARLPFLFIAGRLYGPDALGRFASGAIGHEDFAFLIDWKHRVGFDYNLSRTTYQVIRENGGSLHGINLDPGFRHLIATADMREMTPAQQTFFYSLDLNATPHQRLIAPLFTPCHGKKEGEDDALCRARLYRVQVAWDSYMGQESAALARSLLDTPKEKLVVIAGAYHLAFGLGANLRFARHSSLPFLTLMSRERTEGEAPLGFGDLIFWY